MRASNATTPPERSSAVTHSCRTFVAATTNSAAKRGVNGTSGPRSPNSHESSDRATGRGSISRVTIHIKATVLFVFYDPSVNFVTSSSLGSLVPCGAG